MEMNQRKSIQADHTQQTDDPDYLLGHSESELDRLISQNYFFGELTEQVLRKAGIGPGMRVLDAGCGAGDISFLAARLVGASGSVIGVDQSPEATATATRRAQQAGLMNVQFLTQELSGLTLDEPVDAIIGRLVLLYSSDAAALLRHLSRFLKPGGIVAFQEMDMAAMKSEPTCTLFETSAWRIMQTFARAGLDPSIGLKLWRIFQDAGLPAPRMIQGARVEGGPDSHAYAQVEQITQTLLPLMQRTGVATAEEVGIETLAARLRDEVVANQAVIVSPAMIGAWTQK
jgi:SAM-dependent methyltransferase